jgi:hypothetical protein
MNEFGDDYTMEFTVVSELCREVCIIFKGYFFLGDGLFLASFIIGGK